MAHLLRGRFTSASDGRSIQAEIMDASCIHFYPLIALEFSARALAGTGRVEKATTSGRANFQQIQDAGDLEMNQID